MSILLELLGKGLDTELMSLVLPATEPFGPAVADNLTAEMADATMTTSTKLRTAIHCTQNGCDDQAARIFQEILEHDPGCTEARLAWAAANCAGGMVAEALDLLGNQSDDAPQDVRVLFAIGYCHERIGQPQEALIAYQKACQGRRPLRQARERCAAIHTYLGQYQQALEHCDRLRNDYPGDVWAYLVLGQLYLQTDQPELAEQTFERALTIEPDNFDLHDDQVDRLIKKNMLAEAIQYIQQQIHEQGEFPDLFVKLADIYAQTGNDEAAVRTYNKALENHPEYLEAAIKLGTQHLRKHRHFEAAASFNHAVEINDRLIIAYVGLAIAQHVCGKTRQALDTFDLAGALEPNTNLLFAEVTRLQLKLAHTNRTQNDILGSPEPVDLENDNEAERLLEQQIIRHQQALDENPNHANLHYRYALLLRTKGQTEPAIHHLRQALQINSSFLKAHIKLALALREDRSEVDLLDQLRESFTLRQEYADLHYKLALLYCDKIQFAMAVEHFGGTPDDDCANVEENLQLALQNMGLVDRAAASWRAICELEPQSQMAFQAQRCGIKLSVPH